MLPMRKTLLPVTLVVLPAVKFRKDDVEWKLKSGLSREAPTIEIETEDASGVKFPKGLEPLARMVLSCEESCDVVEEKLSLGCSILGARKTGPKRS